MLLSISVKKKCKVSTLLCHSYQKETIVKMGGFYGKKFTCLSGGENHSAAVNVIKKDLFDLTIDDLEGFDVVIDAFGAWTEESI